MTNTILSHNTVIRAKYYWLDRFNFHPYGSFIQFIKPYDITYFSTFQSTIAKNHV